MTQQNLKVLRAIARTKYLQESRKLSKAEAELLLAYKTANGTVGI